MYSDHDHVPKGKQGKESPCQEVLYRKDGTSYVCGGSWTSVVHRPDQYRHWCAICETGGDHD